MVRKYSGSPRGRYVRGDVCPHCSADEPRSSRLESDIFSVLQLVLGPGEQGVPVPADQRIWLDMLFRGGNGIPIGIEYDGAYWHAGREVADLRKSDLLMSTGTAAIVVRIRESPLTPLTPEDVEVQARASAPEIAIAVLLHLIHLRVIDGEVRTRVAALLAAAAVKVGRQHIYCRQCQRILLNLLHSEKWRGGEDRSWHRMNQVSLGSEPRSNPEPPNASDTRVAPPIVRATSAGGLRRPR